MQIQTERQYHLVSVNAQTDNVTYLTRYPMVHRRCMVVKSKCTEHPGRRIEVLEVDRAEMRAELTRAIQFADAAHESVGQKRKYSGMPYILHPVAVMQMMAAVPHTQAMLLAAVLHDVV